MSLRSRAVFLVAALLAASVTVRAQFPPGSIYRLLDHGEIAVPTACPCIREPFQLPQFVPFEGTGLADPLETDRGSAWEREEGTRIFARERPHTALMSNDGLSGNGSASFGVAMYLAIHAFIAAKPDPDIEEQATRWFNLAAQQGHPQAPVRLAYRYRHGRGVAKDDDAAAYWLNQGALSGDTEARIALGLAYASGRGVPQDWMLAVQWWQRAASSQVATLLLGDAAVCGLGVERSYDRAVAAYRKAGDAVAQIRLGDLYSGGCIEGPEDAALKAYTEAADRGYPDAQVAVSELLLAGRGRDPDPYTAYRYARLAELRLPAGPLKARAAKQARLAGGRISKLWRVDNDKMIEALLKSARR